MKFLIVLFLSCATDLVALFLRVISPRRGVEILRTRLLPWHCKTVLKIYSKKLSIQLTQIDRPAIYIFNHQSSADLVILGALGFSRSRFFISRSTLWLLPITLFMKLIKATYLSKQDSPEKRIQEFKSASLELKKYRESAIISPEGQRSGEGLINSFNKGPFQLAKDLNYPIIQLLITFQTDGFSVTQIGEVSSLEVQTKNLEELRKMSLGNYLKNSKLKYTS